MHTHQVLLSGSPTDTACKLSEIRCLQLEAAIGNLPVRDSKSPLSQSAELGNVLRLGFLGIFAPRG